MRVAVIGAGAMGTNHARLYTDIDDVDLVGVADLDVDATARLARRYRCAEYEDYRVMLDQLAPEAVSITVPTEMHCQVALDAIARGCHVLVEKPFAPTLAECDQIIAAAAEKGVKLMVGHVERFNPAVVELKRRLDAGDLGRIFQVHARRLSPFPGRVADVGVILDLATHDLDVMRTLVGAEVTRVFAETAQKAHAVAEDLVSALLRFANGVLGVLEVNWLTPTKVRELTVLGEGGMYLADYLTQDVYWYQNTKIKAGSWDTLTVFRGASEGDMIKIRLDKKEPLRAELESFLDAVMNDRDPEVSGEDGRAAIDLGLTLLRSGLENVPAAPLIAGTVDAES